MKKRIPVFSMTLLLILAAISACEFSEVSEDAGNPLPGAPVHLSFNVQTIHTQQYVRTDWIQDFDYPVVTVITSKNELDEYYDDYRDKYNFDRSAEGYSPISFNDAIENYSEEFFENNFIVIVLLSEYSGSIRHEVESVDSNGEIMIIRKVPEIGTSDMAQWTIIIELNNDYKAEQYSVDFIEKNV